MKNKIDKVFIIGTLLCLAPMMLTVMLYDELPNQIAIHWNSAGVADDFASKAFAGFGLPVIMTISNAFLLFILNIAPKKSNYPKTLKFLLKWMIPTMTLILVPITLFMALGLEINLNDYAPTILGILFVIIGNYLPKTKQNYIMGIRIPWTYSSEENWNRTHRLAGYIWMIGGICVIFSNWAGNYRFTVSMIILILLVIIPTVYSYMLYKKGI